MEEKRKLLRLNPTKAESKLWDRLSNKQLEGRKFRRQVSVEFYVLDFYCPSEKLCIELDGETHLSDEALIYDEERTAFLNSCGIRVIRFWNEEVFENIEGVLDRIKACFSEQ